jgi:hypothetical protein
MSNILSVMSESSDDFLHIVWPRISHYIGGGTVLPVETVVDKDFAKQLDMKGGIDAWQVIENQMGLRGIASRVQWGHNFDTFTVRYLLPSGCKTEYDKRMYAIQNPEIGLVYPFLTIQAYLTDKKGSFTSAAIIKTKELYQSMIDHPAIWKDRTAAGGNVFKYVDWEALTIAGYGIIVVK